MRFDTINASQYLVWRLNYARAVRDMRDDGDIILLDLHNDQQVMIVLVERRIDLNEVRYHYETNTANGIYTLMLLWVDMFLPRDGSLYQLDDWMLALTSAHGGKLYGYEVAGRDAFFFPVHMRGQQAMRRVRFGNIVDYAAIGGETVTVTQPPLAGTWRVGGFGAVGQGYRQHGIGAEPQNPIATHLAVLGLHAEADLDEVKLAYRTLARIYHPDVSDSAEADSRMKRINRAYQAITQYLEGQS